MADTESGYDWAETKGFHREAVPSLLVGAVVVPIVLAIPLAAFGHRIFESAGFGTVFLAPCVFTVPLGAFFGYLVGIGRAKQRLAWVRWAEKMGWEYEAKPPHPGRGILTHVDQLDGATLWWGRANKQDLIGRRIETGGACMLSASTMAKAQLHGDNQSVKQQKKTHTGICVYLVMDTGSSCGDLTIHPRVLSDRIPLPDGHSTVKFELDDFNQAWTVRAVDPKDAFDRIGQKTIDFLLQQKDHHLVEFKGGLLIVQYWISEDQRMRFQRSPRLFYEKVIHFTEALTRAVPDDLVPPLEIPSVD